MRLTALATGPWQSGASALPSRGEARPGPGSRRRRHKQPAAPRLSPGTSLAGPGHGAVPGEAPVGLLERSGLAGGQLPDEVHQYCGLVAARRQCLAHEPGAVLLTRHKRFVTVGSAI